MDIFLLLFAELIVATAAYYLVFFAFIFYWHLKKTTYVVVPIIFSFDFFLKGFFIISIITIAVKFLPLVINYLGL